MMVAGDDAQVHSDPALLEVREHYRNGDLVLFVGAGVSNAAGLPSWAGLVTKLAERAKTRGAAAREMDEIEKLARGGRLIDALTAVAVAVGELELVSVVKQTLDDRQLVREVPEIGKAIASLAPRLRAVLTTNLDHLLERAFEGAWPALHRATGTAAQERGVILKLHGTLLDADTWVLTRNQYDRAMYNDSRLADAVASVFRARVLLFVGYGLADDDFDQLLARMRAVAGVQPPRHYALIHEDQITPFWRKLREDAGVRVIPYRSHADVPGILRWIAGDPGAAEAREGSTPIATLVGRVASQETYLTSDALVQLWRKARVRDELRFNPPSNGFEDKNNTTRVFQLGPGPADLFLGREPLPTGHKNDLVLPHIKVSRRCLRVTTREGRTFITRLAESNASVTIGMHVLAHGEERAIYHGQTVTIGQVVLGTFVDGRYTQPHVSTHAIDPMTGLLGRDGIAWEIALALRLAEPPRLLLLQPKGDGAARELAAGRAALAIHALLPSQPVARLDDCAIVMLSGAERLDELVAAAQRDAGGPVIAGRYLVDTAGPEAAARVEQARGALERASALATPGAVLDLNQHTPALLSASRFEREASALLARGSEIVLAALADRDRLEQLGTGVCSALELEVLEMLGRAAGPEAILARLGSGVLACAAPGAITAAARDVAAGWRALGPVQGENIEVERDICIETVRAPEALDLARRATELASGPALRIEALPAPLALRVRAALGATSPIEAATTFVELVRESFRFASVALISMLARSAQTLPPLRTTEKDDASAWLEPWRSRAAQAAATLASTPGRTGALVSAWFDRQAVPQGALATAARLASVLQSGLERRPLDLALLHREAQAIRPALDALVSDLGALRGWALVAVDRTDFLDPDRDAETVSYIDYTGSFELGAPRQVTLLSGGKIRRFVYLARFAEGIIVPLDPFARRRLCPTCGVEELFWAEPFITTPGRHAYRSVHRGHVLEDEVQLRDIPPALRGAAPR
jgi:SIR2-like domain